MKIAAITIFPAMFRAYMAEGVIGRAMERGIAELTLVDVRDFTDDRHRTVDDTPYGGGPGMVMKAEPFGRAIDQLSSDGLDSLIVMTTPQGRRFDQQMARELSLEPRRLIFVCGRYEGIDDRLRQEYQPLEVSVGDFVLTGGELPALVIIDAAVRLLHGVVGDEGSLVEESFGQWGMLDYPHFTRPAVWRDMPVPEVLASGNHKEINLWRRKEALRRTLHSRPELLNSAELDKTDKRLLEDIQKEDQSDGFAEGS